MPAKLRAVSSGDPEGEFLAAVEAMPEGYLDCRGGQHRFNVEGGWRVVDSRREEGFNAHHGEHTYAYRRNVCDRCIDPETGQSMVRHDFYRITSHRGHTFLEKISATYEAPPGYATSGLGRIAGNRGLVLGAALDRAMNGTPVRGRGRPRKGA